MIAGRTILLVDHSPSLGGATRVLLDVARCLQAEGARPHLLCDRRSTVAAPFRALGAPVHVLDMPWLMQASTVSTRLGYLQAAASTAGALTRLARRHRAALLHANSFSAGVYCAPPSLWLAAPLVWHVHDVLPADGANRTFARLVGRRARRILCVSSAVAERLWELGVDPRKCQVLHNAFTPAAPEAPPAVTLRGALGAPGEAPIIGTVGAFVRQKGLHVFLAAAARVAERQPQARFVLIGDTYGGIEAEYRTELEAAARRPPLAGRVSFLGWRDDVAGLLPQLTLLVHPAIRPEAFALVVLEAMDAGVPVIASALGGVPELVAHGRTGLLVPPADPAALADATCALLEDEGRRRAMAGAARERRRLQFAPEGFRRALVGAYEAAWRAA